MTVADLWFCCGYLLPVFGVKVSVSFTFRLLVLFLARFGLFGGRFLGGGCSLGWPCVRFVFLWFWLFPVLVLGLGLGSDCFGSWSLRVFNFFVLPDN